MTRKGAPKGAIAVAGKRTHEQITTPTADPLESPLTFDEVYPGGEGVLDDCEKQAFSRQRRRVLRTQRANLAAIADAEIAAHGGDLFALIGSLVERER